VTTGPRDAPAIAALLGFIMTRLFSRLCEAPSPTQLIPSYPYLFPSDPAPPFNGKQPNSSFHSEGQVVGGSYLFDGGYVGAAVSHFSTLYHIPTMEGAATNGRIALEQVKYTSKG
jgi:iron complex outermembrane recepter protein